MNRERRRRFDAAYDEWKAAPVVEIDQSGRLREVSTSLAHVQRDISEMLEVYRATGDILPAPVEPWHEGQAGIIGRELRRLRAMAQTGRQQVATRELLERAQILKRVWDAYGAAIGI